MKLNNENFNEITKQGVVLVDFWAPWCGPCKMLLPVIEQLEEELQGKLVVGKVNVDECEEVANRFGIQTIPTLLIFKDGVCVEQTIGYKPKGAILNLLEQYL